MKKTMLLLILILIYADISDAKSLYVNNTGSPACSDSTTYSNNSASNPWCTLGRAVWGSSTRTSPSASQAAQAGDTVYVSSGVYSTTQGTGQRYEPTYNPVNSGTSGNYITFQCASGTCELRSTGSASPIAGAYQRNYIKWNGFYVDENNISASGDSGLMVAWASSYVELSGNILQARYVSYGEANNHSCIRIEGSNNILVKNNRLDGAVGANGRNDAAITIYTSGYLTIENNNITNNRTGIYIKAPINYWGGGESLGLITVRYNLFSGMTGDAIAIHRAKNGRIYQNVILNSQAGITWFAFPDPTPTDYIVANNTIYNTTVGIYIKPVNLYYINNKNWNNIVSNSTNAINAEDSTCTAIDFEHNLYYSFSAFASVNYTNYTFATWKSACSQDSVTPASLNTNPLFVDAAGGNFRLQSASPARNAGQDILDLNNNGSTTDSITLGAYISGNETIGIISSSSQPATAPPGPLR